MKRNSNAMSYIEVLAAIAVTAMLASLALPSYTAIQRGTEVRNFRARLLAMSAQARSHAIESGLTTGLSFDRETNIFEVLEQETDGTKIELNELAAPSNMVVIQMAADRYESPPGGWWVPFYSDGTSAGGGAEIQAKDWTFSFIIDSASGSARLQDGALPDLSQDQWKAGTYEKRP